MSEFHRPKRPGFTVRIAAASLGMVTAVVVAGCGELNPLSDAWSRGQIDLVESFTDSTDYDWHHLAATDLTSEVCGSEVNCVQAVGNEYLTLLKFGSVAAASDYAEIWGTDAAQIDPLVVHFNGTELSAETREGIIYTLRTINASSPD